MPGFLVKSYTGRTEDLVHEYGKVNDHVKDYKDAFFSGEQLLLFSALANEKHKDDVEDEIAETSSHHLISTFCF